MIKIKKLTGRSEKKLASSITEIHSKKFGKQNLENNPIKWDYIRKPKEEWRRFAPPLFFWFGILTRLATAILSKTLEPWEHGQSAL